MVMKMRDMMKRKNGQKGFTLVELIVVMAILAILGAIAVPKYAAIKDTASVNADAATAASIISAARIQETQTGTTLTAIGDLTPTYMVPGDPQSGGEWDLSGGGSAAYVVTWTPGAGTYKDVEQTVTEGAKFEIESE